MDISLILVIIGTSLIVMELVVGVETGFDLLLIGSSVLIGGLTGYYTTDIIGIFTAALLAVTYVSLGRKYVKNKLKAYSHNSNVDNLLGRVVIVKSWNEGKGTGTTNIEGEVWRIVTSMDTKIAPEQKVKILNIDGVSLIVEPVE